MPPAGGEYRAEQVSYLAGLVHRRQTEPGRRRIPGRVAGEPAGGRSAQRHRHDHPQSQARLRQEDEAAAGAGRGTGPHFGAWANKSGPRRARQTTSRGFSRSWKRRSSSRSRKRRRSVTTTCRTMRCSTNSSRARRRPRCGRCWPICASSWCRWWRRSSRAAASRSWRCCAAAARSTPRKSSASKWPRRSASISTPAGST